jgi:hypothetical protein
VTQPEQASLGRAGAQGCKTPPRWSGGELLEISANQTDLFRVARFVRGEAPNSTGRGVCKELIYRADIEPVSVRGPVLWLALRPPLGPEYPMPAWPNAQDATVVRLPRIKPTVARGSSCNHFA